MLEQLKPDPKTIVSDLVAGLTVSMVNLAELMGYALVAGVSPIYGLYSGIVAPIPDLAATVCWSRTSPRICGDTVA